MIQIGKKYHKNLAALVIVLALSAVVILFHLSGVLDKVEFKLYDFRINRLANTRPRSNDIYMILLDDESIEWAQRERGWGWPWPREAYAEFLDYMRLGHANSVVFDVIFSEPSIYRNNRQDEIINNATRNLQTVQTAVAAGDLQRAQPLFRELAGSLQDLNARADDAAFVKAGRDFGRVVHGGGEEDHSHRGKAAYQKNYDQQHRHDSGNAKPSKEFHQRACHKGQKQGNREQQHH